MADTRLGGKGSPSPLAPATIRHAHSKVFASALLYATQEGWLPKNPAARTSLPKDFRAKDFEVLTHKEVENVANKAGVLGTPVDRLLVLTLATCGLRISEAAALQKKHIDLETKRITISQAWVMTETHQRILSTPKNGKTRKAPPVLM